MANTIETYKEPSIQEIKNVEIAESIKQHIKALHMLQKSLNENKEYQDWVNKAQMNAIQQEEERLKQQFDLIKIIKNCSQLDIVQAIKQGAEVNQSDQDGYTPLHIACANEDGVLIEILLKSGAYVNKASNFGDTPLMILACCNEERCDLVELLLSNKFSTEKVNVNCANKQGNTALHMAVYMPHTNLAKLLLQHGADPNIMNKANQSAKTLAFENNSKEMINLLSSTNKEIL